VSYRGGGVNSALLPTLTVFSCRHTANTCFARCLLSYRLIGMFLVVAFSSSLDVAAIEMEMGLPLDYNR
jgi:hypothetical protein